MSTVYINEIGVRPWESIQPTQDTRFTTTTLIDHDFQSVWTSWCNIMENLSSEWPIKREWRSSTTATFNSRTEEYLFIKNATKTLQAGDLCKKNEKTNIYSTIKNRPNNPREIENLAFEGSHDVLLLIQKNTHEIHELWSQMTIFESHITPDNISTFLESSTDTLLCRFYDSETHAAAQFIYQATKKNIVILDTIESLFKKINIKDVHHYINRTQKI